MFKGIDLLVDGAGAQNDLELSRGAEHALDAVDVLHGLGVAFAVVHQHQTEAGGTVGGGDQIFSPSHVFVDLLGYLFVIHSAAILSVIYFSSDPGAKEPSRMLLRIRILNGAEKRTTAVVLFQVLSRGTSRAGKARSRGEALSVGCSMRSISHATASRAIWAVGWETLLNLGLR